MRLILYNRSDESSHHNHKKQRHLVLRLWSETLGLCNRRVSSSVGKINVFVFFLLGLILNRVHKHMISHIQGTLDDGVIVDTHIKTFLNQCVLPQYFHSSSDTTKETQLKPSTCATSATSQADSPSKHYAMSLHHVIRCHNQRFAKILLKMPDLKGVLLSSLKRLV